MYPIVLAIVLGVAIASVYEHVIVQIPFLRKVKFINQPDLIVGLLSILVVWYGDVSILGAYGFTGATWIDIVGSGLVIASADRVLENFLERLPR
jgi:hypothetical protein